MSSAEARFDSSVADSSKSRNTPCRGPVDIFDSTGVTGFSRRREIRNCTGVETAAKGKGATADGWVSFCLRRSRTLPAASGEGATACEGTTWKWPKTTTLRVDRLCGGLASWTVGVARATPTLEDEACCKSRSAPKASWSLDSPAFARCLLASMCFGDSSVGQTTLGHRPKPSRRNAGAK